MASAEVKVKTGETCQEKGKYIAVDSGMPDYESTKGFVFGDIMPKCNGKDVTWKKVSVGTQS